MNGVPRQALCGLIATYGRSLCDDPRRCEALLRDHCSQYRREIFVLTGALKEGVVAELLASATKIPNEMLLLRLAKRLHDNLALAEEAARWAVESWALALGVISTAEIDAYSNKSRANVPVEPSTANKNESIAEPTTVSQNISPADSKRSDVFVNQPVAKQSQSLTQVSTSPAVPAKPAPVARFKGYASFSKRCGALLIDILFILLFWWGAVQIGWIREIGVLEIFLSLFYYPLLECSAFQGTLGKLIVGIKVTDIQGERVSLRRAMGRFFAKILFFLISIYISILLLIMLDNPYYLFSLNKAIEISTYYILIDRLHSYELFSYDIAITFTIIIPTILFCFIKFTKKKQTPYDKISGCLMVNR